MTTTLVRTPRGQRLSVGDIIAQGGEAEVRHVLDHPDWLAKIYTVRRDDYADKLRWMVDNPPEDPNAQISHPSIAWPRDVLFDARGQCVGYLMPRILGAYRLLEVFNPRLRAQTLPSFDWRYLHRAARNLASALVSLHGHDYVIGDLNESNVLVKPNALVTLIDTDSFQVRTDKRVFPCPVARWEYLPPELHGRALDTTTRAPQHDAFGLAVLIYQLLMDGSHPFRARWLGAGDPPEVGERIRQGLYPYAPASHGRVAPLPNVLPLDALDPALSALFRRAFVDGYLSPAARPIADEWKYALDAAEQNLVPCAHRHYYARQLAECPWCVLQRAAAQPVSARASASPPPTGASYTQTGGTKVRPPRARRTRSRRSSPMPGIVRLLVMLASLVQQGTGGIQQAFQSLPDAVRFLLMLAGRSGLVVARTIRFVIDTRGALLGEAISTIGMASIAMGAIWAIIGAAGGTAVLALAAYALNDTLLQSDLNAALQTYALMGAAAAGAPALGLGALLMGASRYRDVGGAYMGMLAGAAVVLSARPLAWGWFLALGAAAGLLFGMAALAVAWPLSRYGVPFTFEAMGRMAREVRRRRNWRTLFVAVLWGLTAALFAKLLVASLPVAVFVGAAHGFLGGVAVAMRKP
ncbi:MAG: hypothetical protein HZB53_02105 [Chloroflexi bacterium]|nr:hypothetical protein [Chloroflexota bacterium]